ncbi:MAG: MBL fold metallo-hydrolase [Smithella sp.]
MNIINEIKVLREETPMWPASANVFLIRDREGAILIDVGCGKEEKFNSLKNFLKDEGFTLQDIHTIVISHAHPDHMGAMSFLLQEISPRIYLHELEIPLAADPQRLNQTFDFNLTQRYNTNESSPPFGSFNVLDYFAALCPMASARATNKMVDGDLLCLGNFHFQVVHTPGHAPGHVSLFEPDKGLLFTGDVVGKVVAWYSPSSGGAIGYLDGLERIAKLNAHVILPSHGENIGGVREAIERTRTHILNFDSVILRNLNDFPLSFVDLCAKIYHKPAARFFPGPQLVESHLIKLEQEGKVTRREGGLVCRV